MTKSNKIIQYPQYEDLKDQVERLKVEISMLILEKDELLLVESKNIEASYMLLLGNLEYQTYEMKVMALMAKRKFELIQAKVNRQEKVDIENINKALDEEFESYKEKLKEQISKMNEAIGRGKADRLSREETKELKKLYRAIVKKLHPDLNPDQSQEELELFVNTVSAYENGDLETLRAIDIMMGSDITAIETTDSLSDLYKERERLEKVVKNIKENIIQIKSTYPYNLKEIIEDDQKIEARRAYFSDSIEDSKAIIQIYERRIKELMKLI